MAGFYSGRDGRMLLFDDEGNEHVAAKVVNWSFTSSQGPLETTTLQDNDQTYINGLRSLTGSCRLYYYRDPATDKNSASYLINEFMNARTVQTIPGQAEQPHNVVFQLWVVDKFIKIGALITSVSMSMAVGEVVAADVSFQSNGAPRELNL